MKHLAGEYYHVYNRGANKQSIFHSPEDYRLLLKKIKQYIPKYPNVLIAYCLMPNHYHFLFRVEKDCVLSPFIQRVFNSYSQIFNYQHNRSGTLFEGRAKSKWIGDKRHVIYVARYIHLNPIKAGIVHNLIEWEYSNYLEWLELRNGTLVDRGFLQENFSNPKEYQAFVESGIPTEVEKELEGYLLD